MVKLVMRSVTLATTLSSLLACLSSIPQGFAAIQSESLPRKGFWKNRVTNTMSPKSIYGATGVQIEIDDDVFPDQKAIDKLESSTPGATHGWFNSCYENAQLHYMCWLPRNQQVQGILVYAHGINSQCNKGISINGRNLATALIVEQFLEQGIAVYTFDQYGHGFSEGKRFLIPQTWKNNQQDFVSFCHIAAQQHANQPKIPMFIAGESYGGCLALHVARYFQDYPNQAPTQFDSLLLTAPAIVGDLPGFPMYQILRYGLAPLFPNRIPFFMPNTISPERIWRDEQVRQLRVDPEYLKMGIDGSGRKFKLGTALNLVMALEAVRKQAIPGLTVPFCVLHGTNDYGVPIEGAEYLMEHSETADSDREFHRLEGSFHDLFTDPRAEEAMGHWISFVRKRVQANL